MLRRQRRISRIALRHLETRFHFLLKPSRLGVHIAHAHRQRVRAQIVKQRRAAVFKKQRQIIFHPRAKLPAAHRLIHRRIVRIAVYLLAETAAENLLRRVVGGELVRRQQADFRHRRDGALAVGVKRFDTVNLIVKQINAIWRVAARGEQIHDAAAHGKFAARHHVGYRAVTRFHQILPQRRNIQPLPRFQPKRAPQEKRRGRKTLHGGGNGHKQRVRQPVFQLPQHRQPLRHQILMRRKPLIRQRFPVGQKQRIVGRAEKLPRRLQPQRTLRIGREHDFQRFGRQVLR